jgi:DNA-directed RNA polymerase specialized sigma24 family protein
MPRVNLWLLGLGSLPKRPSIRRHLPFGRHAGATASEGTPEFSVELDRQNKCLQKSVMVMRNEPVKDKERIRRVAGDPYWLAYLLTGSQDISVDIAADAAVSLDHASPFFSDWMQGWQRRLVIGRALTAIQDELAESARRTQLTRDGGLAKGSGTLSSSWSLTPDASKADLQQALLSIDVFPRAVLILLVFEGVPMEDAAALLDADPGLIRAAQAIGLRELTANLAGTSSGETAKREAPKKLCSWLRITAACQ